MKYKMFIDGKCLVLIVDQSNYWLVLIVDKSNYWVVLIVDKSNYWVVIIVDWSNYWVVLKVDQSNYWVFLIVDQSNYWVVLIVERSNYWVVLIVELYCSCMSLYPSVPLILYSQLTGPWFCRVNCLVVLKFTIVYAVFEWMKVFVMSMA